MNIRWSASNLTTPGGQQALAIPLALALTGLVTIGVAFVAATSDDPMRETLLEIGGGVFVVFAIVTWLVAMRTRARATLGWEGEALRLEVTPPGKPSVSYVGPFRADYGFLRESVHTGRGSIPQLVLQLAIVEERTGRCVLYLRELLGAIYEPPPGWIERVVTATGTQHVLVNSVGRLQLDELERALSKGR